MAQPAQPCPRQARRPLEFLDASNRRLQSPQNIPPPLAAMSGLWIETVCHVFSFVCRSCKDRHYEMWTIATFTLALLRPAAWAIFCPVAVWMTVLPRLGFKLLENSLRCFHEISIWSAFAPRFLLVV